LEWLGWFKNMPPAHREALALAVVVVAAAALRIFSKGVRLGRPTPRAHGNAGFMGLSKEQVRSAVNCCSTIGSGE
jgi:hypothetical protein